jgi:hypothetical protein
MTSAIDDLRRPVSNQSEIDRESARLLLHDHVKTRRCATCWGPVVLKWLDEEWGIVCPRGCQPGGHISENYVISAIIRDTQDAGKVLANYPELNPHKLSREQVEGAKRALFGEEE